jgi:hypothetical protein
MSASLHALARRDVSGAGNEKEHGRGNKKEV